MLSNQQNNLLSKQQYLALNRLNFAGLTNQQKEQKYQQYRQSKLQSNRDRTLTGKAPGFSNSKSQARALTIPIPTRRAVSNAPSRGRNNNNNNNAQKFKFSKCLLSYARASIDPFDNITELPCIPDVITQPSYKYRAYMDTVMTVGELGTGWAVMNPWYMLANDNGIVGGVSHYPVVTTNATYDSAAYNWAVGDIALGEVSGYNAVTQFTSAQVAVPGFSWRLVAAGMQLEYTGVLLNQSGTVTVLQYDGLEAIPIPYTSTELKSHVRAQTCPTSREARCYVRYEPVSSSDYDYQQNEEHYTGVFQDYPLIIYVAGAEPATTFRVRCVAFYEIQAKDVAVTPSEADPIGFPAFQAARTQVLPTPDPPSDLLSILKRTASNIMTSISGFAPTVGTAIGSIFGQPAIGGVIGEISKDLINSIF